MIIVKIFGMIVLAVLVGNCIEVAAELIMNGAFPALVIRHLMARAAYSMAISSTGITPLLYWVRDVSRYLPSGEILFNVFVSALLVELILRQLISSKNRKHSLQKQTMPVVPGGKSSARKNGRKRPPQFGNTLLSEGKTRSGRQSSLRTYRSASATRQSQSTIPNGKSSRRSSIRLHRSASTTRKTT